MTSLRSTQARPALILSLAALIVQSSIALPCAAQTPERPIGQLIEHQPIAMRDGVRLDATIQLPTGQGPFPTILVRTPYPISAIDEGRQGGFMAKLLAHGYAIVNEYERGMYWSEGTHTYMARAKTDGYDTIDWIVRQPWASGKVGTYGCSSTAENQLGLITSNHPAHRAAVVLGYGAGIGRIGPYAEQGDILRGGALQLLIPFWNRYLIGADGPGGDERPVIPSTLTQEQRARVGKFYTFGVDEAAIFKDMPTSEFSRFYSHLPSGDVIKASGGLDSGWNVLSRLPPADPAWSKIDFVNEGDSFGVPTIWGVSWYDVSVGPNLYLYQYAKTHLASDREVGQQWLIAAPVTHCSFQREGAANTVGDMNIGDAGYDYDQRFIDFFDWKLKGVVNGAATAPKALVYQLGENRWTTADDFPTAFNHPVAFYLASDKGANSSFGDGSLRSEVSSSPRAFDEFTYDPLRPVQTIGGGLCCMGPANPPGAFDQANVEARQDVLVYSTPPLNKPLSIRGPVSVELYVSSDAKDTDFAVKLVDVYPDGRAFNLEDTIFRTRYREGYDNEEWLATGKVYKVVIPPMFTAATFLSGHRLRLEISSSNFPQYERNLNSGGKNADETRTTIAHNQVFHSRLYPSRLVVNSYSPKGQ